jgi:hypothetical protein
VRDTAWIAALTADAKLVMNVDGIDARACGGPTPAAVLANTRMDGMVSDEFSMSPGSTYRPPRSWFIVALRDAPCWLTSNSSLELRTETAGSCESLTVPDMAFSSLYLF